MKQEVKTSSGFQCEIDKSVLDDMEILDLLLEVEDDPNNSIIYFNRILKKMMDKETRDRLYDHIRENNGRVPVSKFTEEFNEIFKALKDGKKS